MDSQVWDSQPFAACHPPMQPIILEAARIAVARRPP